MAPHDLRGLADLPALRALARNLERAAARGWMELRAGARACRPHLARARAAVLRTLRRHPGLALALALRLCWWTGLALLLRAGPAVLAYPERAVADTGPFALGLGLCALAATLAPSRTLRVLGVAQGTLHAAFLTLLWLTTPA